MATYPIKMLRDENQEPFVPMVSADSIYMNDGKSFEEKLAGKIGVENLAEGTGINIETKDDITTISVDFGASDNIIDNLDTTVAGQGPLDARQGNVLKNMIPTIVDNLDSTDATKVLSANQGRELKEMSVPVGGATGQVLKKASNNDHELEWGDAADPNAIVGDGSIMKIIELTYAEYKTLESNGELKEDTEYHITDVENGSASYITGAQIQAMIDNSTKDFVTQVDINNALNSRVVYDHTLTAPVSSWTVEGLDLDGHGGFYHLNIIVKGDNSAIQSMYLRVNDFTQGHYAVYARGWANPGIQSSGDLNGQHYLNPDQGFWQFAEINDKTYGYTSMDIMKAPDGIKMNAVHSLISQEVQYGGTYTCNLYSTTENLTKLTFWQSGGNLVAGTRITITKM